MEAGREFRAVCDWNNGEVCEWVVGRDMQSLRSGTLRFADISKEVVAAFREHEVATHVLAAMLQLNRPRGLQVIGKDLLKLDLVTLVADLNLTPPQASAVMEGVQRLKSAKQLVDSDGRVLGSVPPAIASLPPEEQDLYLTGKRALPPDLGGKPIAVEQVRCHDSEPVQLTCPGVSRAKLCGLHSRSSGRTTRAAAARARNSSAAAG